MSAHNDGGPAFPVLGKRWHPDGGFHEVQHDGMTLRDYFAAKAMAAFLSNPHNVGTTGPKDISGAAWGMADAMLASRGAA